MVNLTDYQEQDFSGLFGGQQEVNELLKAMQAGNITGRDTADQSLTQEPLKVESLEKTLKLLEFRMKDIKLWNAIPKLVAYNTVEEYIQLESYGTDRGGFYGEGELSDVEDSAYRRKAELVKYIQVTGEVTLQAQMVRSYVDAMRKEVENKTMWIIRKVNSALTKADSSLIGKEFNGLYAQHAAIGSDPSDIYASLDAYQDSTVIIDLRGASLTQSVLEDAAVNVDANFGNVDSIFGPPTVMSGLYKDFFQQQRIITGTSAATGVIGTVPKAIDTQFGQVAVNQDKFMKKAPSRLLSEIATSPKAPAAPAATTQALTGADAGSRFASGEAHTGALGTVFYAAAAFNEYGESALDVFGDGSTKITLTAGESVSLTMAAGAGGSYAATGYVIYRSKVTASGTSAGVPFYPIFKISAAQLAAGYDGGGAGIVFDRNRFLPDTEEAFVSEMVDDVMSFKQLAPISKLDLAVLAPSNRFISFLWGTPILYTPKKMLRFLNAGPYVAA
jgi:hypothetical protein